MRFLFKILKRKLFTFETLKWFLRGFNSPAPQWVKVKFLKSQMVTSGDWIESGTYLGDTTSSLSRLSGTIVTIEPDESLFAFANWRHRKKKNVIHLFGTSEDQLSVSFSHVGTRLNIWLDGHFSGDITFLGKEETPLRYELNVIENSILKFEELVVFVDDVRSCFHSSNSGHSYPPLKFLIDWATRNNGSWLIDQDIFVAKFSN